MICPYCKRKIPIPIPIDQWIEKKKLDLSTRRAQVLAKEGRIPGAFKRGRVWYVPDNSKDPRLPEGWQPGRPRSEKNQEN